MSSSFRDAERIAANSPPEIRFDAEPFQKVAKQLLAVLGSYRLGMKLHAP
jgi:hypothetical protein